MPRMLVSVRVCACVCVCVVWVYLKEDNDVKSAGKCVCECVGGFI